VNLSCSNARLSPFNETFVDSLLGVNWSCSNALLSSFSAAFVGSLLDEDWSFLDEDWSCSNTLRSQFSATSVRAWHDESSCGSNTLLSPFRDIAGDLLIATSTRLSELQSWCFSGLLEAMALEAMPDDLSPATNLPYAFRNSGEEVSVVSVSGPHKLHRFAFKLLFEELLSGQKQKWLTSGSWLQYVFSDTAGVSLL
jgi:hypothetical protein